MKSKGRFFAVMTAGEITIHAAGVIGDYYTMCGLDGDDPSSSVDQVPVDVPKGAKINCKHCLALFEACKEYRRSDFQVKP